MLEKNKVYGILIGDIVICCLFVCVNYDDVGVKR